MTSEITILCAAPGRLATKTHTRRDDGTVQTAGYDAGFYFDAWAEQVSSIRDLAAVLRRAEGNPRLFVVRGQLKDSRKRAHGIRRRYHRSHGDGADLERADRRWLATDLDGAPAPDWLDPSDPASLRRAVDWAIRTYLPAAFHGATCFYRWSASAGVKQWSELRLQLWFWLDRPACDPSIKAWLSSVSYVDGALYQPVQPHYIAAPRFVGMPDPLAGNRSGVLTGVVDEVTLPPGVVDLATWEAREAAEAQERKRQAERRKADIQSGRLVEASNETATDYARRSLEESCSRVANATESTRHVTIFKQARWVGGLIKAGLLAEWDAADRLKRAAAGVLPKDRRDEAERTVSEGIEVGKGAPFDVSRLAMTRRRAYRANMCRRVDALKRSSRHV